ncbi:hypothetical protein P170DRAFT_255083 [Aspergillus steynii IBT 23096]|uniref:Uncharacterized protein n=1 Tax=Aspergillus steynii IBT 23096 TaxID=1392250 RepID=A0A2I2FZ41_9EURO|nr:uncharacterized protein P170DRAFT_255083 [Aspergillus steynii IBT 23096]PLB45897.1 hypothetical protein P170DRAFT_255083 [Aspergillus steynii IBT 23096]
MGWMQYERRSRTMRRKREEQRKAEVKESMNRMNDGMNGSIKARTSSLYMPIHAVLSRSPVSSSLPYPIPSHPCLGRSSKLPDLIITAHRPLTSLGASRPLISASTAASETRRQRYARAKGCRQTAVEFHSATSASAQRVVQNGGTLKNWTSDLTGGGQAPGRERKQATISRVELYLTPAQPGPAIGSTGGTSRLQCTPSE